MRIKETVTNFDKHIQKLAEDECHILFFNTHNNPARFQEKAIKQILEILPKRILICFHLGVTEKKARSISRSTSRKLTKALGKNTSVNIFILPPAMFRDTIKKYNELQREQS